MSMRNWLQSTNLSESSESLQGISSSACCSARTTSAASRHMNKRKCADGNDLGVDDPQQIRLRAYPVSMFKAKKRCFSMLRGIRGGIGWNILSSLVQLFAFLATILNLLLEETFEECVVSQLLQPMAFVIGSMQVK